jgi:hypothetical protein
MRRPWLRRLWLMTSVLAFVGVGCNNDDSPAPRIDRLAPPQAKIGEVINILGERFCAPDEGGSPTPSGDAAPAPADAGRNPCAVGFVTFGPVDGLRILDAEEWTDTRIIIRVPQIGPGPTGIVVTVNGRQSPVADFEVIE